MMNFKAYSNVTKIVIPDGVQLSSNSFENKFSYMKNLQNVSLPNSVNSLNETFRNCLSLNMSPWCGENVTNMSYAYTNCYNLTGSPVCGEKVTDMSYTYYKCRNLIGSPVCGNNVTGMTYTYYECRNLTGSPVCGNNVTDMSWAYKGCSNLASNGYFYSNNISNMHNCFWNWPNTRYLNLYLPANSTSLTTALTNNTSSLIGANITWTDDLATNNCYYNTQYNIYIYPVENVAAARTANGDD